eukprot:m51a1_g9491 hypothetical protein (1223) ;mRNA; r:639858-646689
MRRPAGWGLLPVLAALALGVAAQAPSEQSRSDATGTCGDGRLQGSEQCDGGAGCDNRTCLCNAARGFRPTVPRGLSCGVCGDSALDEGEECESWHFASKAEGMCQSDCRCARGYAPSCDFWRCQPAGDVLVPQLTWVYSEPGCPSRSLRAIVAGSIATRLCRGAQPECARATQGAGDAVPRWQTVQCGANATIPPPGELPRGLLGTEESHGTQRCRWVPANMTWVASGLCPLVRSTMVTCLGENEVVEQDLDGCSPVGLPRRRLLNRAVVLGVSMRVRCLDPRPRCGNAFVEGAEECDGGAGCNQTSCRCLPLWRPRQPRQSGCLPMSVVPKLLLSFPTRDCSGEPSTVFLSETAALRCLPEDYGDAGGRCVFNARRNQSFASRCGHAAPSYSGGLLELHYDVDDVNCTERAKIVSWSRQSHCHTLSGDALAHWPPQDLSDEACAHTSLCIPVNASVSLCGNGKPEPGEECDGGQGCGDGCKCLGAGSDSGAGYSPKIDRSSSCGFCGDSITDLTEECDGSTGCSGQCVCKDGYRLSDGSQGVCEPAVSKLVELHASSGCRGHAIASQWTDSVPEVDCNVCVNGSIVSCNATHVTERLYGSPECAGVPSNATVRLLLGCAEGAAYEQCFKCGNGVLDPGEQCEIGGSKCRDCVCETGYRSNGTRSCEPDVAVVCHKLHYASPNCSGAPNFVEQYSELSGTAHPAPCSLAVTGKGFEVVTCNDEPWTQLPAGLVDYTFGECDGVPTSATWYALCGAGMSVTCTEDNAILWTYSGMQCGGGGITSMQGFLLHECTIDSTRFQYHKCQCSIGAMTLCGNGIVDPGEQCDGTSDCLGNCSSGSVPFEHPRRSCRVTSNETAPALVLVYDSASCDASALVEVRLAPVPLCDAAHVECRPVRGAQSSLRFSSLVGDSARFPQTLPDGLFETTFAGTQCSGEPSERHWRRPGRCTGAEHAPGRHGSRVAAWAVVCDENTSTMLFYTDSTCAGAPVRASVENTGSCVANRTPSSTSRCQRLCGNGRVDPWEQCDGGLGCDKCRCAAPWSCQPSGNVQIPRVTWVFSEPGCPPSSLRTVTADSVAASHCSGTTITCANATDDGTDLAWVTSICGPAAVFPDIGSLPLGYFERRARHGTHGCQGLPAYASWVASGLCPLVRSTMVTCLGENEVVEQRLDGCSPVGSPRRRLLNADATLGSPVSEMCYNPHTSCGNAFVEGAEEVRNLRRQDS